ncbi:ABC transporter permease [Hahella aquimaris]|uniref:ABC transporter permease n=1 Tax=Hahella sp. HNIBRBA332 TaxID=3015983 RepID=UPI00273AD79F|nr:ABC transporter permease [Hahella sp. HNIBRBA332]WLQ14501.1 ABC transporter permease [Hahella sp. HNIBRBA332]
MKRPAMLGLFAQPPQLLNVVLALAPFVILIATYLIASDIRLADNPSDKLLPSLQQMGDALHRLAFEPDRRSGDYVFWADTLASLQRLAIGLALSTLVALIIGLNMGAFNGLYSLGNPILTFIAMIPPLALLPILFISLGIGELGKVALIFIGVFPIMTRDMALSVRSFPREQVVKAKTLGASDLAVVYKILLPQMMPRLITALRLSIGSAWLFLIASEAIAATEGLGYRIFLVRRYLSMDVIIPYVMWITLLGFMMDWALRLILKWRYKWYEQ